MGVGVEVLILSPITRNDVDEVFDAQGNVVSSTAVVRDVTEETNYSSLREKAASALATNATALALPDPTPGNDAYLALPDPTPGNDAYLAQPAIPASPTLALLVAAVRVIREQVDALTRQNSALVDQVDALTRQNNALRDQVRALTRQNNALIRLSQQILDSVDDT